jgi:hypothetical protein
MKSFVRLETFILTGETEFALLEKNFSRRRRRSVAGCVLLQQSS